MNKKMGLIGKKVAMTHVYDKKGARRAATVIYTPNCVVTAILTEEKHGYTALQVGVLDKNEKVKEKRVTKPLKGQFKDLEFTPKMVQEFRVSPGTASKYKVGQSISNDIFEKGQFVDVRGKTIGKGFQGVMKRYHFGGFETSHGIHESFRGGGSIGQRTWPGKVYKGRKMPGQMGNKFRSILNLEVLDVNSKENFVLVSGAIPGAGSGWVQVRHAVKD